MESEVAERTRRMEDLSARILGGGYVGPRERYFLWREIEEEVRQLQSIDDDRGLTHSEYRAYKQMKELLDERQEKRDERARQRALAKTTTERNVFNWNYFVCIPACTSHWGRRVWQRVRLLGGSSEGGGGCLPSRAPAGTVRG